MTDAADAPQVGVTIRWADPRYMDNDSGDATISCYEAADYDWEELSLNWRDAPGTTGAALGSTASGAGIWREIDVTSALTGAGTHAFVLTSSSGHSAKLGSKEAGWKPYLQIEYMPGQVA